MTADVIDSFQIYVGDAGQESAFSKIRMDP